ncbi:hypothetical protein [Phenylobacterium sp.]|uniref:hypothetical protein n=1 Tax=Phenylobacterium sp. TaxID=1871053 RepID=UPI0028124BFE|nr:hypothetical protein [Phenylobacterium sp.]
MQTSDGEAPKKAKAATQAQVRTEARRLAISALKTLQSVMEGDGQAAVRMAAAREILDRGYGRPKPRETKSAPAPEPEGMTVIVRKFTDPPGCREVDDGGEA